MSKFKVNDMVKFNVIEFGIIKSCLGEDRHGNNCYVVEREYNDGKTWVVKKDRDLSHNPKFFEGDIVQDEFLSLMLIDEMKDSSYIVFRAGKFHEDNFREVDNHCIKLAEYEHDLKAIYFDKHMADHDFPDVMQIIYDYRRILKDERS